jgi:hypothetical protein
MTTPSSGREIMKAIADLFEGVEFISLRPNEKWMLVELLALANRNPSQMVGLSFRRAAWLCRISETEARNVLKELCDCGFVARIDGKGSTHWRLTMLPYDGVPATRDYRKIFRRCENGVFAGLVAGGSFFTPQMEKMGRAARGRRNKTSATPHGEAELLAETAELQPDKAVV